MKVLNISFDDYANFAFDNAEALRSVGVDARSVKLVKHPFGYRQESIVLQKRDIFREIAKADVVQLMHSYPEFLAYCVEKRKRVFVYHTGTNYRQNPASMNAIFNPYVERCFTDQCEFFGLGAKNLTYIATAIEQTRYPSFGHQISNPYKIGHFPSNPDVKGTAQILEMLKKVQANYELLHSVEKVSHKAQGVRVNSCDIYIELFKPLLNGKPYGCYGVSAFEAAAAGKIVITQNIREDVYQEAYGDCELIICNNEKTFIDKIEMLLKLPSLRISERQTATYFWVVNKHSYQASGKRLLEFLK